MFICSRHFGDECFINEAQFGTGFAHRLILKDGSGLSDKRKDPSHDSEPEAVCETASNFCFVGNRYTFCACDSLALPTVRLQELGCFQTES